MKVDPINVSTITNQEVIQTPKNNIVNQDKIDFDKNLENKLESDTQVHKPNLAIYYVEEDLLNQSSTFSTGAYPTDETISAANSITKVSESSEATKYDSIIETISNKYNVDSHLVKSVIKAESNYNEQAVSGAGAMGLMQLMPKTAEGLGVKDPFDATQNIEGGVKYLSNMLDRYDNNVELALAAYNAGPGNVDKYGGVPPFEETQNYIKKILS